MGGPNHYEVIGLGPEASQAEIESRYQDLARLYQIESTPAAEGMGGLIAEAYRVLSNPSLRAIYDGSLQAQQPDSQQPNDRSRLNPGPRADRPMDLTQEIPATLGSAFPNPSVDPALDRTVEIARPRPDADLDKKLAAELTRRGISNSDVQRLVSAGAPPDSSKVSGRKSAPRIALPIPPPTPYVPKPTIHLPGPRESSVQERAEADRLLTSANIARRRNNFKEAEKLCRQAVDLVPSDSGALELYGDVLQSTGRVDDAILAYKVSSELDPSRTSAEKKYGDLMLRQDRSIAFLQDDQLRGNRRVTFLLVGLVVAVVLLFVGLMGIKAFLHK